MTEIFQNIREIYDFSQPCEELASFIEFFSESSADKSALYFANGHSSVKMFASWTPTFYINLGSPYVIDLGNVRYKVNANEAILISRNTPVTRHNLPTDRIFTVKFYPGGLEAILGINQAGLGNQLLPLQQVLPAALLAQVMLPIAFEERMHLMQSFLLTAFRKQRQQDHYLKMVNDAIGEYSATGMQLNTSQLAERLFLSSKTINRYFHQVVGISPKSYFATVRARSALTTFIHQRDAFSPDHYGYYDHSHFYRDIAKFTGQKLSDHLL